MNVKEYNSVKEITYSDYCDYLQEKYGKGKYNYMTGTWNKNRNSSRTNDGLVAHHKYENRAARLADPTFAKEYPYEWQSAENLIYCDYLEHLLLHILICEERLQTAEEGELVGMGGIIDFIVPELNDLYSGFEMRQQWRKNCYDRVIGDKDVYMELIKRLKIVCATYPFDLIKLLPRSFNKQFGAFFKKCTV